MLKRQKPVGETTTNRALSSVQAGLGESRSGLTSCRPGDAGKQPTVTISRRGPPPRTLKEGSLSLHSQANTACGTWLRGQMTGLISGHSFLNQPGCITLAYRPVAHHDGRISADRFAVRVDLGAGPGPGSEPESGCFGPSRSSVNKQHPLVSPRPGQLAQQQPGPCRGCTSCLCIRPGGRTGIELCVRVRDGHGSAADQVRDRRD